MPTMNYSYLYLSRYGRINFVVKLQRFVTERDMARVPVHCTVRANQVQEKLSRDSRRMQLPLWLQERASTNFVRE